MNVKQGDLAILTNSMVPENIGRIVRVLEFVGAEVPGWCLNRSDYWAVEMAGGKALDHIGRLSTWGYVPDAWLKPVSGLPVEEYDRIMEKEPA